MSAPGSGKVIDGFNPQVNLWAVRSGPNVLGTPTFTLSRTNPITQNASYDNRTIVNTTLPFHQFEVQVESRTTPISSDMSLTTIVGTGPDRGGVTNFMNDLVGLLYFGTVATLNAIGCAVPAPGQY